MASGKTCPDCGSSNLVDDSLYSQSQLVCADCGSVVSEGLLTTTRSEEIQGTDVRYSESTAVVKEPCRNQIQGLKRVRALCRILRFPRVIEETAESLFQQAYEHPAFLKVSLQKKELLGGSCVLLSSRQHNWPVAMGTIYSLLEASEHAMGAVYSQLVKILNVEAPANSVMDLLQSHCHQYRLSPADGVPDVLSEPTERLVERASQLVELAAETWLVTGRHPVPVLAAAVYLAWLSLNPCRARLCMPLARFCQLAKVGMPGRARARVAELKEVLCRLARELPWLRGTPVEPRTIPSLTADILKHRMLLMAKAMLSFQHELSLEPPAEPCLSTAEPLPALEPHPSAEPLPTLEPHPSTEPLPTLEPHPSTAEPLPALEPHPSTEPLPTLEPHPSTDPLPTLEPHPSTEPLPTLEPHPSTESLPSAEPHPSTAEPLPSAERHPSSEGTQAASASRSGKAPPQPAQMQAYDWLSREASRVDSESPLGPAPSSENENPNEKAVTFDLDSQNGHVPGSDWAKRHLFAPPCTRNPRKKRRLYDAGPAVTGHEEISDSEIEGYLRTPQEVKEFAELQKRLTGE